MTADVAPTTVVGRHCEAGDVLAVPCSGAYHHSFASTYNLIGRPRTVVVRHGSTRTIIRRETVEHPLAREVGV